jgi:cytochrome c2
MTRFLLCAIVLGGLASQAVAAPLHDAVGNGDLDEVRALVSQGQDIEEADKRGSTPLHVAAIQGRLEIVEFLISAGAHVNVKNSILGWTPLYMAAFGGHDDVAILLVANQADIDASSTSGNTPLHVAAEKGYVAIVELLVTNGADVNAKNKFELPPMYLAGKNDHLGIVDYLIKEGAVGVPVEPIAGYMQTANAEEGRRGFLRCAICHAVEEGERDKNGPSLRGVLDRQKAGLETFEYTRALSRLKGKWTYEELNAFLASPRDFVPGTTMGESTSAFKEVEDISERADIIAYLRELSENPPPLPE